MGTAVVRHLCADDAEQFGRWLRALRKVMEERQERYDPAAAGGQLEMVDSADGVLVQVSLWRWAMGTPSSSLS